MTTAPPRKPSLRSHESESESTTTFRKPSVCSGPGACCAPRGSRERSSLVITKGAERLSNDFAPVLTAPGFPDPPSPFQSSRDGTPPQPCPSPSTRAERVWARKTRCAESFGGSRDETRSRPGGCVEPSIARRCSSERSSDGGAVRKRDSARTRRIRGGLVELTASAWRGPRELRLPWWIERARCAGRSTDP